MADVIDSINKNKKIDIKRVKNHTPLLKIYQKIYNDFFKILSIKKADYINKFPLDSKIKEKYKGYNLDKIREDMIGSLIFQFWINTGRKEIIFVPSFQIFSKKCS